MKESIKGAHNCRGRLAKGSDQPARKRDNQAERNKKLNISSFQLQAIDFAGSTSVHPIFHFTSPIRLLSMVC